MSYRKAYVDTLCAAEEVLALLLTSTQLLLSKSRPMRAAIDAASALSVPTTTAELEGLWFARVARTASHELGHCFGIADCVHYGCNMQSSSGLKEDARQPPFLCPVCLAKVGYAVCAELGSGGRETGGQKSRRERYVELRKSCHRSGRRKVAVWCGLRAWIVSVLGEGPRSKRDS